MPIVSYIAPCQASRVDGLKRCLPCRARRATSLSRVDCVMIIVFGRFAHAHAAGSAMTSPQPCSQGVTQTCHSGPASAVSAVPCLPCRVTGRVDSVSVRSCQGQIFALRVVYKRWCRFLAVSCATAAFLESHRQTLIAAMLSWPVDRVRN